jgi:hypothetical protein
MWMRLPVPVRYIVGTCTYIQSDTVVLTLQSTALLKSEIDVKLYENW